MHKASITALRDWLKTCPLIAEEQDATCLLYTSPSPRDA